MSRVIKIGNIPLSTEEIEFLDIIVLQNVSDYSAFIGVCKYIDDNYADNAVTTRAAVLYIESRRKKLIVKQKSIAQILGVKL